jgi:hypothetical protein
MTRFGTLPGHRRLRPKTRVLLHALVVLLNVLATVNGLDELPGSPAAQPTLLPGENTLPAPGANAVLPPLPSTCPFRTANYITNTLPQKCLKTNWPGIGSYAARLADIGDTTATTEDAPPGADAVARHISNVTDGTRSANDEKRSADPSATKAWDAPANSSSDAKVTADTPSTETESESPLDNAKFLSFEEWKKLNLERAGQSPESIQQGKAGSDGRRRQDGPNNDLHSLGDEGEIDIGFGGFGDASLAAPKPEVATQKATAAQPDATEHDPRSRKSDAGTTSKERFNYASFDCAATILKTNPRCKSSSSILVENKDSYMLNECSMDNKFLIVELCENIHVDTVVLANFEFFSSMFRAFRVSVSDRYPVKADRWKDLGTFEARNSRDIQAFAINDPLIWAKYLRVEFLSQYGNEFYCPVSLLRVHGTTMIEDYNRDMEGRHEDESEDESAAALHESPPNPEPVQQPGHGSAEMHEKDNDDSTQLPPTQQTEGLIPSNTAENIHVSTMQTVADTSESNESPYPVASAVVDRPDNAASSQSPGSGEGTSSQATVPGARTDGGSAKEQTTSDKDKVPSQPATGSGSVASSQHTNDTAATKTSSKTNKQPASAQQAPSPTSTSQESFFKSIHKRLQVLETNATLSLQYIEEQSKILRDAFTKVEKRQLAKTEEFLQHLNDSVRAELKTFRQQYDQLWQSTVIELETHREQYQREIVAVSSRLSIVADELVFQKRMAVVQSTLLLLCLGLVLFVRTGGSALDLPLMQNVLNKSHSMLGLQFDSPVMSPFAKRAGVDGDGRFLARGRSSDDLASEAESSRSRSVSSSPSPSPKKTAKKALYMSPPSEFSPATKGEDDGGGMVGRGAALRAGDVGRSSRSGPATPTGSRRVRTGREEGVEWAAESPSGSNSAPEESPPPRPSWRGAQRLGGHATD